MTTRIATAAGAGEDIRFFVPFTKVEEQSDGSVYVEGIATGEVLDFHGEVVSYEASKAAFEEWSAWAEKATDGASIGNIRVMHQPIVGGKAVKWWADEATRTIHLGSRIEDPTAAKLCRSRAYTGYSIGGNNVTRELQPYEGKSVPWVTAYRLSENSIVDKPACPTATFTLVKRIDIKEIATMKPIEFLKAHLSAVLLCAAAMPEKDTLKIGDQTIIIAGTADAPVLELRKDATSAVVAGAEALGALKAFMIEVLGMDGDPDLWTIGDICEAMRYCFSARMGAQYAAANAEAISTDTPVAAIAAAAGAKTDDKVEDPAAAAGAKPTPEPQKAAAPTSDEITLVIKTLTDLFDDRFTKILEALKAGTVEKAAPAKANEDVLAKLAEIETVLKALPAPPPGRPAMKSLGGGAEAIEQVGETAAMQRFLEKAAAKLTPGAHQELRLLLAAAAVPKTQ